MGGDLLWGLGMMGVGMGAVFVLLLLLMALLLVVGRLDRAPATARPTERDGKIAPQREEAPPAGERADGAPGVEVLHDGLTADQLTAIALAVITHAHVRRAQAAPEVRAIAPGSQLHASRWVAAGRAGQNAAWRRK